MSSENTGRLVTVTLKQLALDSNGNAVETGATKANEVGDDNYIAPIIDYDFCPLPTTTTTSTTTTSTSTTTTTTAAPNNFRVSFIPLGFSGITGNFQIKRNYLGTPDPLSTTLIDSLVASNSTINRNSHIPIVTSYFIIIPIITNSLSGQYDCVITQGGILGVGVEIGRQSINIGDTPTLSFFAGAEINYNDVYIQLQLMATTTTSTTSTTTSTTTTSTTTSTTTTTTAPPNNFAVSNLSDSNIDGSYSGLDTDVYSVAIHSLFSKRITPGTGYSVVLNNDSTTNTISYSINGNTGTIAPLFSTTISGLTTPIIINVTN